MAKTIVAGWPGDVMILDPFGDEWPSPKSGQIYLFSDIEPYLLAAIKSENRLLVVDETGYMIDRYEKEHHWLATQSRHSGHSAIFISQRYTQIPPIIRAQASELWAFSTPPKDAAAVGEDYLRVDMDKILPRLPQFHAVRLNRFKPAQRVRVVPGDDPKILRVDKSKKV